MSYLDEFWRDEDGSLRDGVLDLGHDVLARFLSWAPDRYLNPQYADMPDIDRCGITYRHRRGDGNGADPQLFAALPPGEWCAGSITFDLPPLNATARAVWQVHSLDPLHVEPSLLCRSCGHHGFIREGRWVPA